MRTKLVTLAVVALLSLSSYAQESRVRQPANLAAETPPAWLKDYQFEQAHFTFVRIKYSSAFLGSRPQHHWRTDYPTADEKLAAYIQSHTVLTTDQQFLELTSDELPKHKLLYLVEPGTMSLSDAEVKALRGYLKSGGLVVLDDSFGSEQYEHIKWELRRIAPSMQLSDLPLEHPIFHCVFDFSEKPQVPSERVGTKEEWKQRVGPPVYQCLRDENGRVVLVLCHNTDLGDGWARLGDGSAYARDYSDLYAGPLGLNLIFFALTQEP